MEKRASDDTDGDDDMEVQYCADCGSYVPRRDDDSGRVICPECDADVTTVYDDPAYEYTLHD